MAVAIHSSFKRRSNKGPKGGEKMNKTSWAGIATIIFGIIVLIGAAVECPAKEASISVSIFMILTGACFTCLGKDLEKYSA
ncbi:hypothetical protein AKJ65_04760 [candidate division MSBL1 archaeon SCGC-AAA259E19]|uniref:Uncharacterized protein n=1 Tax=candidate division MSBL1 archaeon SCGC-AAA259E19 TaxID=1698264 RepID=A0A133UJE8_9EURY|nr:hypothetical protein AKJ65_04760 [candidate division MSBL1 archaeon SCGC-AAA259E19]